MLKCQFKSALGIECPGCGAQRSFVELINGNFTDSIILFPALIPLLFTVVFLILHLILNFKKGSKIIIFSFSLTALLMLGNFIYKQIVLFN